MIDYLQLLNILQSFIIANMDMYSDEEGSENNSQGQYRFGDTSIAYDVVQSKEKIRSALADLENEGFDFRYKIYDFQQQQYKECSKKRHRSYLRHQCLRCKDSTNSKKQKLKRFTTSKGTVQFRFKIMKIKKFLLKFPTFKKKKQDEEDKIKKMKYPFVVLWDFYIYHMQCKSCRRRGRYSNQEIRENPQLIYAVPYIYDKVLSQAIQKFTFELKVRMNPQQYVRERRNRRPGMKVPDLRNHIKSLCEACKKKVCQNLNANNGSNNNDSFLDSSSISSSSSSSSSLSSSGSSRGSSSQGPSSSDQSRNSHPSSSDQSRNSNQSSTFQTSYNRPQSSHSSQSSSSRHSSQSNQSNQSSQSNRSGQSHLSQQSRQSHDNQRQKRSQNSNQSKKQKSEKSNKKSEQSQKPKFIAKEQQSFALNLKGEQVSLNRPKYEEKKQAGRISQRSKNSQRSKKMSFSEKSESNKSIKSQNVQKNANNQKQSLIKSQTQKNKKKETPSEKKYIEKFQTKQEEKIEKKYVEKSIKA